MEKKERTCKGCPDRTVEPNCHMTCEDYLSLREKILRVNREINSGYSEVAYSNCAKKNVRY